MITDSRKFLVLGASGRLGRAMVRRYAARGIDVRAWSRTELDLAQPEQIAAVLAKQSFDVLINASGLTDVDYCESHAELSAVVNANAPGVMAKYCQERGARFVQLSTDYVFSGNAAGLIHEDDATQPINVYGRTKLDGERAVLTANPTALVLRVSWLFGLEKPSFPDRIIRQALERLDVSAVNDKWSCPTYADDVCEWLLALLDHKDASGVFHLCNSGECTWVEYGEEALHIAERLGLKVKTSEIRGHSMDGFAPFLAQRPRHTALSTEKFTRVTGLVPRRWQDALELYLRLRHAASL